MKTKNETRVHQSDSGVTACHPIVREDGHEKCEMYPNKESVTNKRKDPCGLQRSLMFRELYRSELVSFIFAQQTAEMIF